VILVGSSCLLSCFGDKEEAVVTYDETAITNMQLTAVNRKIHTKTSKGKDTTYVKRLTTFPKFTVDHVNGKIFNTDSLPSDCDMKHILVSLTATSHTGVLFIKDMESDDLIFYSSTDSIDFSSPREFRAYNTNGTLYKSYIVTMNKHQAATDKLVWEERPIEEFPTKQAEERAKWEKIVEESGLKTFIGAVRKEAYAYSYDNKLMVTRDNGTLWMEDDVDEFAQQLPLDLFSFVYYPMTTDLDDDYVLMVGNATGDYAYCTWRKIVVDSEYGVFGEWVNMPIEAYNLYTLPSFPTKMVYFNHAILAFCPLDGIYESRDGGITWKSYPEKYVLPNQDGELENFDVTTDDGYLWFMDKDEGKVWRGKYFEK
jgi:hypothetical protein